VTRRPFPVEDDLDTLLPLLAVTGSQGAVLRVHTRIPCRCGQPHCRSVARVVDANGPCGEFCGTAVLVKQVPPEDRWRE